MLSLSERQKRDAARRTLTEIRKAEKASRPERDRAPRGPVLTPTPGEQTERRAIPNAWKIAARLRQGGVCICGCGEQLGADTEFDHRVPIALGGVHTPENIEAMRKPCHLEKTRRDITAIAKAKRQAKAIGPREPSKHFRSWGRQPTRPADGV